MSRLGACGVLLAAVSFGAVSAWPIVPFSNIADEIYDAENAAKELEWKVSNSSAEKESVQWFMATALKELSELKKVVLNHTAEGSLGYKLQACINRTTSKWPTWNQSLTREQAMQQDSQLAPSMIDSRMYELYKAQEKIKDLTEELGECTAKCPSSFLLKRKVLGKQLAKAPAPAPAPAPGGAAPAAGAPKVPGPREMMRGIADAIYNTSESMSDMKKLLKKDSSAKQVLDAVTSTIMLKLLKTKKDVEQMQHDLAACEHAPPATHLETHVADSLAGNTDMAEEMLESAEEQTKEANENVENLEKKLADCKEKCA